MLRTRLRALFSVWVVALAAGAMPYFLSLRKPFLRPLLAPIALAVLLAAFVATWRLARARTGVDRRREERRVRERRANES